LMPRLSPGFSGLVPLGLSLFSGLLLSAAFPRPEIWPLIFVGLVPVVLAGRKGGLKTCFGLGYAAGLTHAVTLLYWIFNVLITYGRLPVWLAGPIFLLLVGYLALYLGLFTLGLSLAERQLGLIPGGPAWIIVGAALYTGLEYFKGFFLTGFPWEPLGAALVPALSLIQLSDIVGPGGLTFLVATVNLSLTALVFRVRPGARWKVFLTPAAMIAVSLGLLWGYGSYRLEAMVNETTGSKGREAAVIQGSIDQDVKWDADHRVPILMTYRDLTLEAAQDRPWLIVWPETAAPFFFPQDEAAADWLTRLVKQARRPLLFGSPSYEEHGAETTYFNRAFLLDGRGGILGYYDKVHLVPYGEYVPLKRFFPFLGKITEAVGDYSSGQPGKLLDLNGEKIGVLICYESIFPELARGHVRKGADYLVVITNDAWFGRSSAPYQHFAQAVLRAVETRRTVIRAANTGISGVIWPTGQTKNRLELFKRGILTAPVPRVREQTFYAAAGDLVPRTCLGITAVVLAMGWYRRRKNAD